MAKYDQILSRVVLVEYDQIWLGPNRLNMGRIGWIRLDLGHCRPRQILDGANSTKFDWILTRTNSIEFIQISIAINLAIFDQILSGAEYVQIWIEADLAKFRPGSTWPNFGQGRLDYSVKFWSRPTRPNSSKGRLDQIPIRVDLTKFQSRLIRFDLRPRPTFLNFRTRLVHLDLHPNQLKN